MKGTFTLPETIDPVDSVCVQFQVPNDPNHIAAFWGALEALNKAWNWQYTDTHEGSQVAYVCQQYIDDAANKVNQGIACDMPIDCDEVEICLQTSPTIITINNNIQNNTNNININTTDIFNLDARLTIVEGDVNQNKIDIQTNINNIAQNTADIALHAVLINDNANEIIDHDVRISALEASQFSSGVKSTTYPIIPLLTYSTSTTYFVDSGILHNHTFTYPNAYIYASFRGYNQQVTAKSIFRLRLDTAYSPEQSAIGATIDNQSFVPVAWFADSITTGVPIELAIQFMIDFGAFPVPVTTIPNTQTIFFTIIEFATSEQIIDDYKVTFGIGGDAYTLPVQNIGTVQAGGNPADCLAYIGLLGINNHLAIEIDFGSVVTIKAWQADFYCDAAGNTSASVYMDGAFQENLGGGGIANNTWTTRNGQANWTGQVLRFQYSVAVGTVNDIRMDNICFNFL